MSKPEMARAARAMAHQTAKTFQNLDVAPASLNRRRRYLLPISGLRLAVHEKWGAKGKGLRLLVNGNADNAFTSPDTAWFSLQVWKDINTDGQTDAGELLGLTEAGVQRIQLAYTEHGDTVAPDDQGNQHRQTGTYTTTSGTTRCVNDVWFDVERWNTLDQRAPLALSSAIAAMSNLTLPGTLGSLHQAMARDGGEGKYSRIWNAIFFNERKRPVKSELIRNFQIFRHKNHFRIDH